MSDEELLRALEEFDKHNLEPNDNNKKTVTVKHDEALIGSLKEAAHLDENTKNRYIHLAGLYLDNMVNNIFRNQFELSAEYEGTSIDEWNDFLADKIVSVYINKHKRTLLKSAAEDNLADPTSKNKRDNLKLIENLKAEEDAESNKNICIIRIPEVDD